MAKVHVMDHPLIAHKITGAAAAQRATISEKPYGSSIKTNTAR